MNCKACGNALRDDAKFCGKCGTTVESASPATRASAPGAPTKPCPKCGTENAAAALFCRTDGFKFDLPAGTAAPPASVLKPGAAAPVSGGRGVVCPACGTENPPGAKFCSKDGTALGGTAVAAPRVVAPAPAGAGRAIATGGEPLLEPSRRRPAMIAAGAGAFALILCGLVAFLYWKGIVGNRQGSVAAAIAEQIAARGYSDVSVSIDQDWVATATGSVIGAAAREEALALIRSRSGVASVVDRLEVKSSPGEIQEQVIRVLGEQGFTSVHAAIGSDYRVTLTGMVDSQVQKDTAISVVRAIPGVVDVVDQTGQSLAWKGADLLAQLSASGYSNVTATFVDDQTVQLGGQVETADDLVRITEIAKAATGAMVRTQIAVHPPLRPAASSRTLAGAVTDTPPQVAPPAPEPEQPKPARIAGLWIGLGRTGIFSYTVNLRLNQGAVGEVVGTTLYSIGDSKSVLCSGEVTLQETTADLAVLAERVTRIGLLCPAGGTIKLTLQGPTSAQAVWYSRKSPDKVVLRGTVARR